MFRPACLPLLAALAFVPVRVLSQEGDVVFRSDVSLVRVDAQVLDREHRAVTGLTAGDFVLKEEGQVQQIRNFASEDMPVDIVLLLDVSGSMRTHVERIAAASHTALQVLREQDRVAIMVFDRTSRLRLPFKSSQEDVEAGLEGVLRQEDFNGGTDITRGLLDAANYVRREARRDARRAIVILTDDQTEREREEDKVSRALVNADAVLSALLAPDAMQNRYPGQGGGGWPRAPRSGGPWGGPLGDIVLGRRGPVGGGGGPVIIGPRTHSAGTAEIAQRSGGDSIPVDAASALETTLERIRHRYALHFHLPDSTQPGQERDIEVQLAAAALRRYPGAEVRYRRVYLTPNGAGDALPPPSPVLVSRVPGNLPPEPIPETTGSPQPRRRGVDRPSGPRGPMMEPGEPFPDASRPETAAETPCGGWRRIDEPERPPCADTEAKPPAPVQQGGWREVKAGEKP